MFKPLFTDRINIKSINKRDFLFVVFMEKIIEELNNFYGYDVVKKEESNEII